MNQRLRKIINELKNARSVYTDADLARIIDVSRSELSQMLSGKRPVSKRVVSNLLTKFPEINEDWLRTGVGEMLNSSYSKIATPLINAEDSATAFIGDNNKVNADQTIAMLVAEVAAQRRVTEKVLEQNSELLAMIAANNKK